MGKEYGDIEKIRFTFLESKDVLDKSIIRKIYPSILFAFSAIMNSHHEDFRMKFDNVEILEIKTAKYEFSPFNDTFAKIVIRVSWEETDDKEGKERRVTKRVEVESYIGRAVGFCDNKKMEILFENDFIAVDFSSANLVLKNEEGKEIDKENQGSCIKKLLEIIDSGLLRNEIDEIINEKISIKVRNEIDEIINKKIAIRATAPEKYEKFSSINEILMKFDNHDERYRAFIDALLRQYDDLREEIVRCIYLEQWAIVGLYTSLGLVFSYLVIGGMAEKMFKESDTFDFTLSFLLVLIFIQVFVNGFGSLFLKEQARNRRACSFLKALEHIINKKIGGIGIYWENYITSKLIAKDLKWWEYFGYNIPVNPQYYKNRLLGVGLPIFLPNLLATTLIGYDWCTPFDRFIPVFISILSLLIVSVVLPFIAQKFFIGFLVLSVINLVVRLILFEDPEWILMVFFIISLLLTFSWALMIIFKAFSPLRDEGIPSKQRVLAWLEEENRSLQQNV